MSDVAAIVLAAGRSTRMGAHNKLLLELHGRPLIQLVVEQVCASRARPVVVVTGHDSGAVRHALGELPVRIVHNTEHERGLSSSLRCGLATLPAQATGALVCLGDMPRVSSADIDRLIAAFERAKGARVCAPMVDGKRGNPVLWPARCFAAMRELSGDVGARSLLDKEQVVQVDIAHDGVLFDIDTPDDLEPSR